MQSLCNLDICTAAIRTEYCAVPAESLEILCQAERAAAEHPNRLFWMLFTNCLENHTPVWPVQQTQGGPFKVNIATCCTAAGMHQADYELLGHVKQDVMQMHAITCETLSPHTEKTSILPQYNCTAA